MRFDRNSGFDSIMRWWISASFFKCDNSSWLLLKWSVFIDEWRNPPVSENGRNWEREAKSSSISLKLTSFDHYRSRDNRIVMVWLWYWVYASTLPPDYYFFFLFVSIPPLSCVFLCGWSPQVLFLQKFLIASKANLNFKESISWFMDWVYTIFIYVIYVYLFGHRIRYTSELLVGSSCRPESERKGVGLLLYWCLSRRVYYNRFHFESLLYIAHQSSSSTSCMLCRSGGSGVVSHCVL